MLTLLDTFGSTIKRTTLTRKAWYEIQDFALARQKGIASFSLAVERRTVCGQEQWWGHFTSGRKSLKVIGTLER